MDQAKKLLIQRLVFGSLVAVLGLGVMNTLKYLLPAPGVRNVSAVAAPLAHQLEAFQNIESMSDRKGQAEVLADASRVPVQYTAGSYRDPLVSLLPQPKPADTLTVRQQEEAAVPKPVPVAPNVRIEGMLWGGSRPQALIEGKLYQVGDTVQDSRIVGISRDGVTVVNQGVTFVLRPPQTADAAAQRPMLLEHGR